VTTGDVLFQGEVDRSITEGAGEARKKQKTPRSLPEVDRKETHNMLVGQGMGRFGKDSSSSASRIRPDLRTKFTVPTKKGLGIFGYSQGQVAIHQVETETEDCMSEK